MKTIIKKIFITYLVIICCIYTPTAQAAGWSFGGFNFGSNSLNIVKDGVKITTVAVDTAPITSNLGAKILGGAIRGANILSAISLVLGIAEDAIDWVLDPENNAIKWRSKIPDTNVFWVNASAGIAGSSNPTTALQQVCDKNAFGSVKNVRMENGNYYGDCGGYTVMVGQGTAPRDYKTIPVPTVAQKIFDMAKSGDTTAQADVTAAVADAVSAGAYDTPINKAIADAAANTNNPANPNDNTTPKDVPQIDTSSITAAISSMAAMLSAQIQNLAAEMQGIKSVINTSIDKLLNKQDQLQGEVVNVGSKVDSMGGKVEGLNDNVKDVGGKVVGLNDNVKDVGGKVVGLNDSVDKVGDKVVGVGDKVTGVGDKVDAAGDKVTDAVTGVGADVRGVGDKVTAGTDSVGTKVDAVGDKVADAVKDSTKEITDKIEQTKPKDFELPTFCSWATEVCDFIDWVKEKPPEEEPSKSVRKGTLQDIELEGFDRYQKRIYFEPHCPSKTFELSVLGVHIVKPVDFSGLCSVLEAVSPWLLAATYISCAFFVIREI